ncbi:MAG: hypothetical protein GXP25_21250 [Planctomycetes bacterium]|nr:hypothetical protein [Planctomycetota bacterium]
MKKAILLVLLPLMTFLSGEGRAAPPRRRRAAKPEAPGALATQKILEEPPFVFSRRNRRNPFSSLFGSEKGTDEGPEIPTCTAQDIDEARRDLDNLATACRSRRGGEFSTIYEALLKKLNRPCESDDLRVHALELKRRARNLKRAMRDYVKSITWERELQWAEGKLQEMRNSAAKNDLGSLRRLYQEVKGRIQAMLREVDDDRYKDRMREIILKCTQVLAQHIHDIQKEELETADKRIAKMRELLRNRSFSSVHTEHDELVALLADKKFEDEMLRKRQQKILRTAADINRQAEIGEVKLSLANAKDYLAQIEATYHAHDYAAIADMNATLQGKLADIKSVAPELDAERASYRRKGMDIERRAKICIEFLQAPPKISGIGWHPQNPVAIVNEKTVGLGDYVDEKTRVKSITPETVVFTYKGEDIEQPMVGG